MLEQLGGSKQNDSFEYTQSFTLKKRRAKERLPPSMMILPDCEVKWMDQCVLGVHP